MSVEVYGLAKSAPCRLVYVTCEVIGKKYDKKNIDLFKGENMTPEFLEMNPQHNVPVMKDGDFIMNESRAIATYLINAYGKDSKLYPCDAKIRARIDQRLYFEQTVLLTRMGQLVVQGAFQGEKIPEAMYERLREALGWSNDMIKSSKSGYVADTAEMSVADLAMYTTYTSLVALKIVDTSGYKELAAWSEKVAKAIPNCEAANGAGVAEFGDFIREKLKASGN